MSHNPISVRDLGKSYRVYGHPWHRLSEILTGRQRHQELVALDGVSFELARGESLGIVGQNGAGKSTLLKILSGVSAPTRGEVRVGGSVASLLELGMGFHPEFTGRQNVRLNAAILGLSEDEIERRLPDVIAFSELGEFIDRPVKTYSTGMAMRLGFSIAIHAEPEILIVDEALSVGDGYFQKKCKDRVLGFLESGRTLLFCSHAMYYVSAFCQKALWLRRGRVAALGPVDEVVREYENFLLRKSEARSRPDATPTDESAKVARIVSVRQPEAEDRAAALRHGDPWSLEIEWESTGPELPIHLAVGIDRVDGVQVCSFGTHRDGLAPLTGARRGRARLRVPELPILKGEFALYVFLLDEDGLHVYDQALVEPAFSVETPGYQLGLLRVEHRWDLDPGPTPAAPALASAASASTASPKTASPKTASPKTVSPKTMP